MVMYVTIGAGARVENPRNRALAPRARAKEQPQDEAQKRQEEHDQTPQHLAPGRGAGIDRRNDRPECKGEDNETANAGEFCHGGVLRLRGARVAGLGVGAIGLAGRAGRLRVVGDFEDVNL